MMMKKAGTIETVTEVPVVDIMMMKIMMIMARDAAEAEFLQVVVHGEVLAA